MTPPLSLSMLKMEKNFVAHLEKKYSRKPYEEYDMTALTNFVRREYIELIAAMEKCLRYRMRARLDGSSRKVVADQIIEAMWEVADVSNTLDYLFEGLIQDLKTWEGDL